VQELLAAREIVVRETRLLGPHEHGDSVLGHAPPDLGRGFAGIDDRHRDRAKTRARADDPAAIGYRAL
jgi:hypothetical protein